MSEYTKQRVTMQYTEIVYFKNGEEIGREERYDHHAYDADEHEPMTGQEIEDWT